MRKLKLKYQTNIKKLVCIAIQVIVGKCLYNHQKDILVDAIFCILLC